MKRITGIVLFTLLMFALSCGTTGKMKSTNNRAINSAIRAHGGKAYQTAAFSFDFRKRKYTFRNTEGQFEYSSKWRKDGKQYHDVLTNEGFVRHINGEKQELSQEDAVRFGNSLNSVIYFAQLPNKLDDPAVIKADKGVLRIKENTYQAVEVRFSEKDGGTDHDDVFYYWINQKTHRVDYLAYLFHVDKGGVRFRSAYNTRKVGGILFQDYINYKASKGTPLEDLPRLYEAGMLVELSKIELENIQLIK